MHVSRDTILKYHDCTEFLQTQKSQYIRFDFFYSHQKKISLKLYSEWIFGLYIKCATFTNKMSPKWEPKTKFYFDLQAITFPQLIRKTLYMLSDRTYIWYRDQFVMLSRIVPPHQVATVLLLHYNNSISRLVYHSPYSKSGQRVSLLAHRTVLDIDCTNHPN